jgi:hypothetical protein
VAKAFSILSWNVEHFGAAIPGMPPKKPVGPIIDLIAKQRADVVAIYEVTGARSSFAPSSTAPPPADRRTTSSWAT